MNTKYLILALFFLINSSLSIAMNNGEEELIDIEQNKEIAMTLKELAFKFIINKLISNFKDKEDCKSWFNVKKVELVKDLKDQLFDRLVKVFQNEELPLQSLAYQNDDIKALALKNLLLIPSGFFLFYHNERSNIKAKFCDLNCNIIESRKLSNYSIAGATNHNLLAEWVDPHSKDEIINSILGCNRSRILVVNDLSENKSIMQIYDLNTAECLNEWRFYRTEPTNLKVSNNGAFFVVPGKASHSIEDKTFNSLYIVDAFSGKIIKEYNSYTSDILRALKNINFNCYDISPNDCYILMASNSGYMVKINLKLESQNLDDLLEEINYHVKSDFCNFYFCAPQNKEGKSYCSIS